MKTVLIPTDFNPESINIIDAYFFTQNFKNVKFIFLHAFKLSDSITDMLMLKRRSRDYENISDEFYNQINLYRNKYQDKIKNITIDYFYGSTTVAFKNFIEANQVDTIIYPKHYAFNPINKYSIDPKYLTTRSGCNVIELNTYAISSEEKLFETKMHEVTENTISA